MTWQATPYAVPAVGTQVSPEGGGRILQLAESALTHPTHTDGLVDKGDIVVAGHIVGVAKGSASASTDQIAVDTAGIWCLPVIASNDIGTSAVAVGDPIYVDPTTCAASKDPSGIFLGYALSTLTGSAQAAACVVQLGPQKAKAGNRFLVSTASFAAADTAKTIFVASRPCKLIAAYERHGTKAGQAGTLTLEKCTAGEAAAAGDVMLAAAFDLAGNNDTVQEKLAVTDGKEVMAAGDAIRLKLASGAATSLADAVVTLELEWV